MWRPIEELSLFDTGKVFLTTLDIGEGSAIPDLLRPNQVTAEELRGAGYTYFWDEPFPDEVFSTHPYISGDESHE